MFGFFDDLSSQNQKLLRLMDSGQEFSNIALSRKIGWRFGARLYDLRKHGCRFEKRVVGNKCEKRYREFWKLIYIPSYLHYETGNKIVNEHKKYFTPLVIETVGKK